MPDFLRPIRYFSDGYTYCITQGIGGPTGDWFTVRIQMGKSSMHRVISPALPMRETQVEAQADLDVWAHKKRYKAIED